MCVRVSFFLYRQKDRLDLQVWFPLELIICVSSQAEAVSVCVGLSVYIYIYIYMCVCALDSLFICVSLLLTHRSQISTIIPEDIA